MGKIWIFAFKSLICPDWLTLLSSNFQVSKIKTSSSISIWSKQQPSNHVDGQPPLTLCVSSSSLFVHIAQRAFFLLSVSPHQSRWRGLIAIELCNFWYSDWLVEYMGGGVGERVEICLLSIKCQLTKYDNFIILNPVLLQKEFLCKTMVNISNISNVLFWLSICKPSAWPDPSK